MEANKQHKVNYDKCAPETLSALRDAVRGDAHPVIVDRRKKETGPDQQIREERRVVPGPETPFILLPRGKRPVKIRTR